jgi:hypothetical protein
LAVATAVLIGGLAAGCGLTDPRPAAWEYISPAIFEPNCATSSCHSRAAAVAGLDFSDPDRGYTSLTGLWVWIVDPNGTLAEGCRPMDGKVFCQRQHRPLVTPFDPAQSRVVNMLRAQSAPRMPPDRPLPEADIRLVERWILNGARKSLTATATATDAAALRDGGATDAEAGSPGQTGDAAGSQPNDGASDRGGDAAGTAGGGSTAPTDALGNPGSADGGGGASGTAPVDGSSGNQAQG